MFYPLGFPSLYFNPWVDAVSAYRFVYDSTFRPLDAYGLYGPIGYPFVPSSFFLPSLWRYSSTPDLTSFAFDMQRGAMNAEYWAGLNRNLRDSYYRTLMTASAPTQV